MANRVSPGAGVKPGTAFALGTVDPFTRPDFDLANQMARFLRVLPSCLLAIGIIAIASNCARLAAEEVTVVTRSGRQLTAEVHAASSAQGLWLQSGRPGMQVLRPLEWDHIVEVKAGPNMMPGRDFRRLVESKQWPMVGEPMMTPSPRTVPADAPAAPHEGAATGLAPDEVLPPTPEQISFAVEPARTLHLEAYVANWDDDVEVDGIYLHVFPLNGWGAIKPLHGTLEVELIGQRRVLRTRDEAFPLLARWTRQIEPEMFGSAGAVFQLPFQAIHPEFNTEIARLAVVHGRVTAAGSNLLDATVSMVPIRPSSSPRDHLQQVRGTRFFPNERTGRGKLVIGAPQ